MPQDPTSPTADSAKGDILAPALPSAPPPVVPPPLSGQGPSPVPEKPGSRHLQQLLVLLLSLCLGLFLLDGFVSLIDDTWMLVSDVHALLTIRVIVFIFATLSALVVYLLMGLTPMIPKRIFVPVTLFNVAAQLVSIPFYIYDYAHNRRTTWAISLLQAISALAILYWVQGGFRLRWPLVPETQLRFRRFSWLNTCLFAAVNILVLIPAIILYLWVCAGRAVDHFSDSFMTLRPGGLTVQVRTYGRDDGKKIELVPMSHIGEPEFYRALSRSFPTNALVLMEGVTDNRNLLTNKITYKRVATSLGLAEQQRVFKPAPERIVSADIDVEEFAPTTIDFINVAMLLHARGLNPDTLSQLMLYSPPAHFEERLMDDLLHKRNQHLLEQIRSRLPESENLIVPWGVAHMPEIAKEIQKSGFRLEDSREYVAIRFGSKKGRSGRHDSAGS